MERANRGTSILFTNSSTINELELAHLSLSEADPAAGVLLVWGVVAASLLSLFSARLVSAIATELVKISRVAISSNSFIAITGACS